MLTSEINPLQIFSKREVCRLLGISEPTFERIENKPPRIQISEARYGYRARELMLWQDARTEQQTARQMLDRGAA
jgi:hypothetical protein